ncbi:leucine-rich repeat domain-containing protein, partial [Anaerobutyricum hallii]
MRKRIYAWFMTLVLSITSISSTSIIYADDFSDETEVMTEDEGTEEEYITDDSEIDFDSEEDASINEEQIEEDESEESQDEVTIEQEISEEEEAEVSFDDGVEESDIEAVGDSAQNTYGDFGYEEYNGGVKITNYTGTEDFVSVPAKINGKKVTVIDSEVFAGHSELKSITLPEGLESIGYQFIAGTGITSLTVPSTVTGCDSNYGRYGITEGSSLETLIFADGIKMIPGYFCYKGGYGRDNYTLQHIEIPESVTEIGEKAF